MRRRLHLPTPSEEPTVTVVIPCYNYGRYLPQVVQTAVDQEGVRVDVIIVDDASPDQSVEVARAVASQHDNVAVMAHETNKGHIATYNDGLAAASGRYVVLLSADDLLTPGSLARSTALLEAEPDMALVYGYAPEFTELSLPTPRLGRVSWSVWRGEAWIKRLCRRGTNVIMNPEVVMRRSILDQLGGYDAGFPHAADLYLWLRAATLGSVGRVNGADQALYRVHGQNMHLTAYAGVATDLEERRKTFDRFVENDLADHSDREHLGRLARRALSREAVRWAIRAADLAEVGWPQLVDRYGEQATATWPEIRRTRLWRRLQTRLVGRARPYDRIWFRLDWEVRHRLRWRRWRRFGT